MLSSISGLGETGPEQEWSSGTKFSGYSDIPEFYANLISEFPLGISEFLVE